MLRNLIIVLLLFVLASCTENNSRESQLVNELTEMVIRSSSKRIDQSRWDLRKASAIHRRAHIWKLKGDKVDSLVSSFNSVTDKYGNSNLTIEEVRCAYVQVIESLEGLAVDMSTLDEA